MPGTSVFSCCVLTRADLDFLVPYSCTHVPESDFWSTASFAAVFFLGWMIKTKTSAVFVVYVSDMYNYLSHMYRDTQAILKLRCMNPNVIGYEQIRWIPHASEVSYGD